jgi:IS1 family transposase
VGRLTVDQQRNNQVHVFGAVQVGSKKVLLKVVPNRKRTTLLPLILSHVKSQSTIVTDQYKTYQILARLPQYSYFTVNHSVNYVDPTTGKHTQRIESVWQKMKEKIVKRAYGVSRAHLQSYLDRHAWLFTFGDRRMVMFNFWRQVRELYPCE